MRRTFHLAECGPSDIIRENRYTSAFHQQDFWSVWGSRFGNGFPCLSLGHPLDSNPGGPANIRLIPKSPDLCDATAGAEGAIGRYRHPTG
jgi:hypothetical protein